MSVHIMIKHYNIINDIVMLAHVPPILTYIILRLQLIYTAMVQHNIID